MGFTVKNRYFGGYPKYLFFCGFVRLNIFLKIHGGKAETIYSQTNLKIIILFDYKNTDVKVLKIL